MPLDLRQIAREISNNSTYRAASAVSTLLMAVLEEMEASQRQVRFIDSLRKDLAKRGWRFEQGPALTPFADLEVGECFRTLDGQVLCKMDAIPYHDPMTTREQVFNAYVLENHAQASVDQNERVERLGYASQGWLRSG